MTLDPEVRRRLRPVIDVARVELGDLDADDVPHRLRRVAASSARSLPPPLERSLVVELVENETFRSRVTDRWDRSNRDDPIARAFLADPAAVLDDLERERDAVAEHDVERELAALRKENARMRHELREAKDRFVQLRSTSEKRLVDAKRADKAARAGLQRSADAAAQRAAEAEAALGRDREHIAHLEREIADLEGSLERVTARQRRRSSGGDPTGPAVASPPSGAADLASWLDAVERSIRPFRPLRSASVETVEPTDWRIPRGVSPDRADVIDAVVALGAVHFVVDGYNVSGVIEFSDFSSRAGRDRAIEVSRTLARVTGADVTVVFDALGVDGRASVTTDLGVTVRFATEGSADDAIVALAGDARVVVVTNDRELRERCSDAGSIVVWADALVAWVSSR